MCQNFAGRSEGEWQETASFAHVCFTKNISATLFEPASTYKVKS